ncbi:apolipoprotein D-like [Rhodnius prolixus]|uniref:Putative salivary lipocalin n=1 Tax=Rhodnius prolixus TaxID=13249 RepID=R4G4Z4_RHOPR
MNSKLAYIFLIVCGLSFLQAQPNDYRKYDLRSYLPWKIGACLQPSVVENFKPKEFFKGHWYEMSSFGNFLWQVDGICPTIEYNVTDAGEILELDYHFESSLGKYVTIRGQSYTQFIKNDRAFLPFTYKVLGGLLTFDLPTYILGTDYETWAVVYTCKPMLFLKSEMSWILTRQRNSTDQLKPVLETLKKSHLSYGEYKPAVNVGCGPNEPHL